jgi:hypothetical protein
MSDNPIIQITDKDGVTREKEVVWSELSLEELKYFYLDLGFEEARLEYREREGWDPAWFKHKPTFEELDWWYQWREDHDIEAVPQYWLDARAEKKINPDSEL